MDVTAIAPLSGDAEPGQTAPLSRNRHLLDDDRAAVLQTSTQRAAAFSPRIRAEIFDAGLHNLHRLRNDLLFTGRRIVPPPPEGARRRLLVREYERHFGDFNITDRTPIVQVTRPGVTERLVYDQESYVLDHVPDEGDNREAPPR